MADKSKFNDCAICYTHHLVLQATFGFFCDTFAIYLIGIRDAFIILVSELCIIRNTANCYLFQKQIFRTMKYSMMMVVAMLFLSITANTQSLDTQFFTKANAFFQQHIQAGAVDYAAIKKDDGLKELVDIIAQTPHQTLDANTQQAYLINAYNLLVIDAVLASGVTTSVNETPNFFDRRTHTLGGKKVSLNTVEKQYLLKEFGDPRFHFALICGAKGCPPIANFAYTPEHLEQQLTKQTRAAINDTQFIRVQSASQSVALSQIFNWYASDFGGNKKALLEYINEFRTAAIPSDYKVDYYEYDWSLNGNSPIAASAGNNSSRYVVSAAIPKGTTETKIFNNLYTQQTRNNPAEELSNRANFFTTTLSFLYGVDSRFNAGFDLRYRRVSNTDAFTSPLNVFTQNATSRRTGITNVGPKIRWAPIPALENFSVQSALWLPVGNDLEGTSDQPYIDWDGATWNTQFFNDFDLGTSFSLFTELDLLWEDIGNNDLNRLSTPVNVILSYFPNAKTTLYALGGFSPYWVPNLDFFAQAGVGAKYQVTPNLEFEALYTGFTNAFLLENNGQASTFNLGVRISR